MTTSLNATFASPRTASLSATQMHADGRLDSLQAVHTRAAQHKDGDSSFDRLLGRATEETATSRTPTELREAATQLVASAFLTPLMELVHESTMPTGPFEPGIGERRFRPLLDQQLMDQVATASNFSLVDQIVKQLTPAADRGDLDVQG